MSIAGCFFSAKKVRLNMYEINDALAELADSVMESHEDVGHLKKFGCRIAYMMCSSPKKSGSKVVYADTEKVKDKYKAIVPYDFLITFYEPMTAELEAHQMEILMWHELKHVGFDGEKCKIIPHDTEDFKDIVRKYGVDWVQV